MLISMAGVFLVYQYGQIKSTDAQEQATSLGYILVIVSTVIYAIYQVCVCGLPCGADHAGALHSDQSPCVPKDTAPPRVRNARPSPICKDWKLDRVTSSLSSPAPLNMITPTRKSAALIDSQN